VDERLGLDHEGLRRSVGDLRCRGERVEYGRDVRKRRRRDGSRLRGLVLQEGALALIVGVDRKEEHDEKHHREDDGGSVRHRRNTLTARRH